MLEVQKGIEKSGNEKACRIVYMYRGEKIHSQRFKIGVILKYIIYF